MTAKPRSESPACCASKWTEMRNAGLALGIFLSLATATWAWQDGAPSSGPAASSPPAQEKSQNAVPDGARPDNQGQEARQAAPAAEKRPGTPPAKSRRRRSKTNPPAAAAAPESEPRKIVIHRGGTSEPVAQIIPGMTREEAQRQREESEDLLTAADANVRTLAARNLNSDQQEVVSQIRHYMNVAYAALNDGDIQRAHTLAQKAQLLADDLVKQ